MLADAERVDDAVRAKPIRGYHIFAEFNFRAPEFHAYPVPSQAQMTQKVLYRPAHPRTIPWLKV
jgi:hypothetical protein